MDKRTPLIAYAIERLFVAIKIACRICLYRPATFLPCHHQAG